MLKSQDILVFVKLISIEKKIYDFNELYGASFFNDHEYDFNEDPSKYLAAEAIYELLKVRGLAESIQISKSEVSSCMRRLNNVGLLLFRDQSFTRLDLSFLDWQVNKKAFYELASTSFEYFFHTEPKGLDMGLPTIFFNEKLKKNISYSSELPYIWPISGFKSTYGICIEPIYKSVPSASLEDMYLYEIFSLIDVFRVGSVREKNVAKDLLKFKYLGL